MWTIEPSLYFYFNAFSVALYANFVTEAGYQEYGEIPVLHKKIDKEDFTHLLTTHYDGED